MHWLGGGLKHHSWAIQINITPKTSQRHFLGKHPRDPSTLNSQNQPSLRSHRITKGYLQSDETEGGKKRRRVFSQSVLLCISQLESLLRFVKLTYWERTLWPDMLESWGLECVTGNRFFFIKSMIIISCYAEKCFSVKNVCPENSRLLAVLKTLQQICWICQQGWRLKIGKSFPLQLKEMLRP